MTIVEKKLGNISPRYLSRFEDLVCSLSQKGGGKDSEKYTTGRSFSNVYELYLYAFFLGVRNNVQCEITDGDKTEKFWEVVNWKPASVRDQFIGCAIALSDFNLADVEHMSEPDISVSVSLLKQTIEAYANGGLEMLEQAISADPDSAAADMFLLDLLAI